MAIKKPSGDKSRSYSRGARKSGGREGIAATFRPEAEKRETQKTTMDFDRAVYRALKLYAVTTDRPIRDLVDGYVRAGLEADGVSIE
jgi:hypothetical protein